MSYKSIFVTGADGFIGSHLVEKLIFKGFKVKALVQYNFQNSWGWLDELDKKILKEVEIIQGDLRDKSTYEKTAENSSHVFNLAALIGIPYSYKAPKSYIDTNLKGLMNLMDIIKKKNNTMLIHTSTSEVYGSGKMMSMNENHPLNPQSPYAASKIAADAMVNAYYNSYDIPVSIIRPFNNFGPRQSLRAIIPTIISQTLNKNLKEIKLGNLNVTRDFTYIDDTVNAFLKTINNSKVIGETINIGNNFEVSVKDLVEIISKLTGIKKPIKVEKKRIRTISSEVKRLRCNNRKAKIILKWKPKFNKINGFKSALRNTLDWYKNSKNLKKLKSNIYNI